MASTGWASHPLGRGGSTESPYGSPAMGLCPPHSGYSRIPMMLSKLLCGDNSRTGCIKVYQHLNSISGRNPNCGVNTFLSCMKMYPSSSKLGQATQGSCSNFLPVVFLPNELEIGPRGSKICVLRGHPQLKRPDNTRLLFPFLF